MILDECVYCHLLHSQRLHSLSSKISLDNFDYENLKEKHYFPNEYIYDQIAFQQTSVKTYSQNGFNLFCIL